MIMFDENNYMSRYRNYNRRRFSPTFNTFFQNRYNNYYQNNINEKRQNEVNNKNNENKNIEKDEINNNNTDNIKNNEINKDRIKKDEKKGFSLGPLRIENDNISIFGFTLAIDDIIIVGLILLLLVQSDTDYILIIILALMLFNISFSSIKTFAEKLNII